MDASVDRNRGHTTMPRGLGGPEATDSAGVVPKCGAGPEWVQELRPNGSQAVLSDSRGGYLRRRSSVLPSKETPLRRSLYIGIRKSVGRNPWFAL